MTPRAAALLLALSLASPAGAHDPGPSERIVDTPELTVRLPASARRSEEETAPGLRMIRWIAELPGGTVGLLYTDFRSDLGRLDPKALLDRARDAALARVGATLVREAEVSCDPGGERRWPGRAFEARTEDGAAVSVRLCVVGPRLYQLLAVNPDGGAASPDFDAMVASFRPRAPPAERAME